MKKILFLVLFIYGQIAAADTLFDALEEYAQRITETIAYNHQSELVSNAELQRQSGTLATLSRVAGIQRYDLNFTIRTNPERYFRTRVHIYLAVQEYTTKERLQQLTRECYYHVETFMHEDRKYIVGVYNSIMCDNKFFNGQLFLNESNLRVLR